MELSICHKQWICNPKYLQPDFVDLYNFKLSIQGMHFNKSEFEMSKVLPLGCIITGIGKFEFVANTLFLSDNALYL